MKMFLRKALGTFASLGMILSLVGSQGVAPAHAASRAVPVAPQVTYYTAAIPAGYMRSLIPLWLGDGVNSASALRNLVDESIELTVTEPAGVTSSAGFYINVDQLGSLNGLRLEQTGDPVAVELWFDIDNNGDPFEWLLTVDPNQRLGFGADRYILGPVSSGGVLQVNNETLFTSLSPGGGDYTLGQLKAGDAAGISWTTKMFVWIGLSGGGVRSATITDLLLSTGDVLNFYVDDDYSETVTDGHIWHIDAFDNITDAIAAASPGGDISVGPGTYTEQLTIDKDLTIHGVGSTTVIQGFASMPHSYTMPGGGLYGSITHTPIIAVTNGATLHLTNVAIDGQSQGETNGRFEGIMFRNAGGSVLGVQISNMTRATPYEYGTGVGIFAYNDDDFPRGIAVVGSTIANFETTGIVLIASDTTPLSVQILGDSITGMGLTDAIVQNGIQISGAQVTGMIDNATISGLAWNGGESQVAAGILLHQTGVIQVQNSVLTGTQMGIFAATSPASITGNQISVHPGYYRGYGIFVGAPAFPYASLYGPYPPEATIPDGTPLPIIIMSNIVQPALPSGEYTTGIKIAAGRNAFNDVGMLANNQLLGLETGAEAWQCIPLPPDTCSTGTLLGVTWRDNRFVGNTTGFNTNSPIPIDAIENWWNDALGPDAPDNDYGIGDPISANVTYAPWCTVADCSAFSTPWTTTTFIWLHEPDPSLSLQDIWMQFTVANTDAAGPVPVGTVDLTDGTTVLCDDVTLDASGTGECSAQDHEPGARTLTATFTPADANQFASSFGTVSHRVVPWIPAADFDDDDITEVGVFRPSTGTWLVKDHFTTDFGLTGDDPVPADYDGDGDVDVAVFRPSNGSWYVQGQLATFYGLPGDVPVPGDYNGDLQAELAVYRPSTSAWYVRGVTATVFGLPGDLPVPDDYNGDGVTEIAVFRPSTGAWYVKGGPTTVYGLPGDVPVPGDYNGDVYTELAVFRPSTNGWFVRSEFATPYGISGDIPVPGDYDADGLIEVGVYRPSSGTWYIRSTVIVNYGLSGDYPLPAPDTNADGDPYN